MRYAAGGSRGSARSSRDFREFVADLDGVQLEPGGGPAVPVISESLWRTMGVLIIICWMTRSSRDFREFVAVFRADDGKVYFTPQFP